LEDRRGEISRRLFRAIAPGRGGPAPLRILLGGDGGERRQLAHRWQAGPLPPRRSRAAADDQVALSPQYARQRDRLPRRPRRRAALPGGHAPARGRAQGRAGARLSLTPGPRLSALPNADQSGIKADRASRRLHEIPEVQALVLGVRVGVWILDADEERRNSAQLLAERIDEGNGSAAADGDGLGSVAVSQRLEGRLERRGVGARVPP